MKFGIFARIVYDGSPALLTKFSNMISHFANEGVDYIFGLGDLITGDKLQVITRAVELTSIVNAIGIPAIVGNSYGTATIDETLQAFGQRTDNFTWHR